MSLIKFHKNIALLFGITICGVVLGQGNIDDSEIIIDKNLKIELSTAEKIYDVLETEKRSEAGVKKFSYDSKQFEVEVQPASSRTRVLKMKSEPLKKLYPGYLEVGFGNYGTSLINFNVANKRNTQNALGLNFNHLASFNGPVDNSGISDNRLQLYYTRHLSRFALGGELNYNFDKIRFYGYDHDEVTINNVDSITQNINAVNGKVTIHKEVGNFKMDGFLFGNYFNVPWIRSTRVGYDLAGNYTLNEQMGIDVGSRISLDNLTQNGLDTNRQFYSFEGKFNYQLDKFNVAIGGTFMANKDTILNDSKAHFYPLLDAQYNLDETFKVFIGHKGALQRNNFETLLNENPYLDTVVNVFDDNLKSDLYAGASKTIGDRLFVELKASFQNYENLHNFAVSANDTTKYSILWNTGAVSNVRFGLSADYKYSQKFNIGLSAEINNYSADSISNLYFLPGMNVGLYTKYYIHEKVKAEFSGRYIGGLTGYKLISGTEAEVEDIVDLNLKLTYNASNKMGVSVQINNIVAKKYQYFINYPKKGFNFIVGLNYSF